ncbi:hypothetical protein COV17_01120 [Candidatus Woesearchaeota archaeon CG10_big_fil_rev_8_21_14_0_10_36_11]|nr:MAG: hypothetical protein COV17_01120 [Candidatus Woesearchaeota archaeon CG10_big_fil_rev_8_21_14_0_10_36_11]
MDVERIQKVNNLAVDLFKQGLARDREDAIAQAETIFKKNEMEDYANFKETVSDTKRKESTDSVALDDDTIKTILAKNTTFLVNTIKEFKEKVDSLEREVTVLKSTLARQSSAQRMATVPPIQGFSQQTEQPATKSEPIKDHPRSGNYNDTDVSIEKFFYMGNK